MLEDSGFFSGLRAANQLFFIYSDLITAGDLETNRFGPFGIPRWVLSQVGVGFGRHSENLQAFKQWHS